jgi:hypothetical protein
MEPLIVPYKLGGRKGYRAVLNGIPFSRKPVELQRAIQQAEAIENRGNKAEIEGYALSESDIQKMIPTLKIVSYNDLHNARTIDDVLDEKGRLMLLYLTESEMMGHWVCLLNYRNSNILEYFDPYGNYKPDGESEWLTPAKLKQLGQSTKKLTQLLDASQYEVKSNAFPFQTDRFNMNTCGRHCTVRLYFKNLVLPDYIKLVKSTGLAPDDFVCAFTYNLIGK